jgi:putative membrane protein
MITWIIHWVFSALILLLVATIVPGIEINNIPAAFLGSIVLSVVNMLVKPLIQLLTFPITLLTLGLFSFFINAAMLGLAAYLVPGFQVHGLLPALIGSILLSLLTGLLQFKDKTPTISKL